MPFISVPVSLPCPPRISAPICAKSRGSPRDIKPAKPHPASHASDHQHRIRSPRRRNTKSEFTPNSSKSRHSHHAPPTSSPSPQNPSDVWDTSIDDDTPLETLIRDASRTSPREPSTLKARARMAAQPSRGPKPEHAPSTGKKTAPKKKRGRPKGSKSVNQTPIPQPQVSPFMQAVRDDIRRRSMASKTELMSGALSFLSDYSESPDDVQLSAPNGLPDDDSNADLLQELLPILAEQENEERREISEEEARIRQLVSTCYTQFSSIHRSSDRLDNLQPYKLKKQSEGDCQMCAGTGMTVCEYCKGEGYVDLGENGEKFNPRFGNNIFSMPKHVTGNIYHCPLCGGLQQERCISCFGTGDATTNREVIKGASKESKDVRAWKIFDMSELIEREADRIEIGLDGTIILRAKRRGRRKASKAGAGKPTSPKRRERSPRPAVRRDLSLDNLDKGTEPATGANFDEDLAADLQSLFADSAGSFPLVDDQGVVQPSPGVVIPPGRQVGVTTDFVNTTDYQVGRRLRKQYRTRRNHFQDTSKDDLGISSPKTDKSSKEESTDLIE